MSRGWRFVVGLLVLGLECCSNDRNPNKSTGSKWGCEQTGVNADGCDCRQTVDQPGVIIISSRSTDYSCIGYGCCLLTQPSTGGEKTCTCSDAISSCDAEAASRRDTTVVSQCPPPGEGPPPEACAKAGENCRYDYLDKNELAGCCDGTICRANADGVPTCTAASAEEQALARQCDKIARRSTINAMTVQTPSLRTNVGNVTLDTVKFGFYGVGPGGCLNSFDLVFSGASSLQCQFEVKGAVMNGKLAPTLVLGDLVDCPGYTGKQDGGSVSWEPSNGVPATVEVAFDGLSCDGHLIFESYCVAGTFDIHLAGTLSTSSISATTLEDQHFIANGVLCSQEPMGECPTG